MIGYTSGAAVQWAAYDQARQEHHEAYMRAEAIGTPAAWDAFTMARDAKNARWRAAVAASHPMTQAIARRLARILRGEITLDDVHAIALANGGWGVWVGRGDPNAAHAYRTPEETLRRYGTGVDERGRVYQIGRWIGSDLVACDPPYYPK